MQAAFLSPEQFTQLSSFIQERTGILLPPHKRGLLSNRLRRRMDALGLPGFDDYCGLIMSDAGRPAEWPYFLAAVTTGETWFFRNAPFWETFAGEIVPHLVRARGGDPRTLRLWSAAASNGAEAYTAAIVLLEALPDAGRWRIDILGTDISEQAVQQAEAGLYNDYALSMTNQRRAQRWFEADSGGWRVRDELRRLTRFRMHNLRDPLHDGPFDVVLLRNVLIYFDDLMKRRVLKLVTETLAPAGCLVVGDADPVRAMGRRATDRLLDYAWPGVYIRTNNSLTRVASPWTSRQDSGRSTLRA